MVSVLCLLCKIRRVKMVSCYDLHTLYSSMSMIKETKLLAISTQFIFNKFVITCLNFLFFGGCQCLEFEMSDQLAFAMMKHAHGAQALLRVMCSVVLRRKFCSERIF